MSAFEEFFRELDGRWPPTGRISLRIIGCSALTLQADYDRGTKDSDVLETAELTSETKNRLLGLAGRGTDLHDRHRLYIDIVSEGIPFLPQGPNWHPLTELNASLRHFDLLALDIVDVVVSKLKRFSANDLSDIAAMVDRGLVPHDMLISRFRAAIALFEMDARANLLSGYVKNLHQVERDLMDLCETEIELPRWC